ACVITIGVGVAVCCASLNGVDSRKQKTSTAKSRERAGMHMVHEITTIPSRKQRYVTQTFARQTQAWSTPRFPRKTRAVVRLPQVTWSAQDLTRQSASSSSAVNHGNAVHQHKLHSLRQLIWIFECCPVSDGLGIENYDIRRHSRLEHTPVRETHALRRQGCKLPDRLLQRQLFLFAHVLAQDAGKGSISAWMGMLLAQQAVGGCALRIVVHGNPGLSERQCYIRFGHAEDRYVCEGLVLD